MWDSLFFIFLFFTKQNWIFFEFYRGLQSLGYQNLYYKYPPCFGFWNIVLKMGGAVLFCHAKNMEVMRMQVRGDRVTWPWQTL